MSTPPTVRFLYNEAPGFQRTTVSGVIGGMTPAGLLLANLFFERHQLPREQMAQVRPDGTLDVLPTVQTQATIERELLIGLLMTPESALSIAAWLKASAEAAIAARTGQAEGKAN